ncbi:MAG: NAD(P)/FAD-dependent oxidoreductase, partial [Anaerovorax sp.]
TIVIDLMPQFSLEDVKRRLGADLEKNLKGMIHSKLLPVVLSKAKKMKGKGTLSEKVAQILKGWQIPISGTKSWKEAQVTSGGIPLCEVHLDRMESKLRKNLYFAGEVLDFDGKCGGYNLQWAWETGLLAGNSIR